MGEMIEFKANGRTASGYLAMPAADTGPGLVLLQEWWGLVGHITDVADRFAKAGFVVLAPDLYHGEKAKSPDEAGKLMMALNIADAAKDMEGAAACLTAMPEVSPKTVASIGFCMGGQLALFAACEVPQRIGAAVDFYGVHPAVKPDVSRLSGPVLFHFARRDKSTPPDAANALVQRIRDAGKDVEAYFYEADHAFFNDQRPAVFNADAAKLAWDRTLAFLKTALV
jgi:carboxymethylenebutenolidase